MPVPRDARPLRITRWAEMAYALSALLVVSGLPAPSPRNAMEWVHWLGTAVLAALLALRFRKPNHATWWIAALLAAWVIGLALSTAVRGTTGGTRLAIPTAPLAIALLAVLLGSQVVVAACLSTLRHLRRS